METTDIHPDIALVQRADVRALLPQQDPFVMIDRLVHLDGRQVATATTFRPDNLFVDAGRVSALGLVENIAQTCAARIGFINKYLLRKDIQVGYIGAVRNFVVHALPAVGEEIRTEVEVLEEVFGMLLVTATITSGTTTLATAEVKIALKA